MMKPERSTGRKLSNRSSIAPPGKPERSSKPRVSFREGRLVSVPGESHQEDKPFSELIQQVIEAHQRAVSTLENKVRYSEAETDRYQQELDEIRKMLRQQIPVAEAGEDKCRSCTQELPMQCVSTSHEPPPPLGEPPPIDVPSEEENGIGERSSNSADINVRLPCPPTEEVKDDSMLKSSRSSVETEGSAVTLLETNLASEGEDRLCLALPGHPSQQDRHATCTKPASSTSPYCTSTSPRTTVDGDDRLLSLPVRPGHHERQVVPSSQSLMSTASNTASSAFSQLSTFFNLHPVQSAISNATSASGFTSSGEGFDDLDDATPGSPVRRKRSSDRSQTETHKSWQQRHAWKGIESSKSSSSNPNSTKSLPTSGQNSLCQSIEDEEFEDEPMNSVPARRCSCGLPFMEVDHFCRGCGAQRQLVMDRCFCCGKSLGDDAQFCSRCGRARQVGHKIAAGHDTEDDERAKGVHLQSWLLGWTDDDHIGSRASRASRLNKLCSHSNFVSVTSTERHDRVGKDGTMDWLVHQPIHPARVAFDICGAVLVLYDGFFFPLQVFGFSTSTLTHSLQHLSFVYWNLNMIISFFGSYLKKEIMVTRARKTALHYLKTTFVFDAVALLPDWVYLAIETFGDKQSSAQKLLQIVNLFKMAHLLRIGKLFSIAARLGELVQINSEILGILADVGKSVATLLAISHFLACAWYFCAYCHRENRETWINYYGFEHDAWFYIYTTSLHWSLTQFTPASMDVTPRNLTERIFTVFTVLFAMTVFSYVLGSVSASMAALRSLHEDFSKNMWHVRRFMRQHDVPLNLSHRVQKYLEKKYGATHRKLQFTDVPLFKLLSQQLKNELCISRIGAYLHYHPLLEVVSEQRLFMGKLAEQAIAEQHFAANDCVFFQGEPASKMYFIAEGELEYSRFHSAMQVNTEQVFPEEELWIGEAALWVHAWTYQGCTIAILDAAMISISAHEFADACTKHLECREKIVQYAELFRSALRAEESKSDIHKRHEDLIYETFLGSLKTISAKSNHRFTKFSRLGTAYQRASRMFRPL